MSDKEQRASTLIQKSVSEDELDKFLDRIPTKKTKK